MLIKVYFLISAINPTILIHAYPYANTRFSTQEIMVTLYLIILKNTSQTPLFLLKRS